MMPLAAALGMYSIIFGTRVLYLVYANLTVRNNGTSIPPSIRLTGKTFPFLLGSVVASVFLYAKCVASIDNAMRENELSMFDPFDILGVSESSNATVIKQAYRALSKQHHPDKGGDKGLFQKINNAYRALTTEEGKRNYEQYGHPDGKFQGNTFHFALPSWLLKPQGTTAVVLVVLYLGVFAALIYFVVNWTRKTEEQVKETEKSNIVAGADAAYLSSTLGPESTHLDVLLCIATTPENIVLSMAQIEKVEEYKQEKLVKSKDASAKELKKKDTFDLDDGVWDEDEGDDDEAKAAAAKARKEEEIKADAAKQLAAATGKLSVKLEGIDEGVLGQKWVETTLAQGKRWPPQDLRFLKNATFEYKGKNLSAMDHPAVRRNLCMTMGRLNSILLNSHPDLLEASSKGLIDQTYFKGTMEYRQRCGLLLEAALRVAMTVQSYRLAKTIVETVSMFKIGVEKPTDKKTIDWFHGVMKKQYGGEAGIPRLEISQVQIETPDEEEIATEDLCVLSLEMSRAHAERFTQVKIAAAQQQGIPPQIALQTYREGWWILVRAKKLGGSIAPKLGVPENELTKTFAPADIDKFASEAPENRLLTAWPMIVQNMAQKSGKVKVQLMAPAVPGKYKFIISVMSQEFLGADQEFEVEHEVVDSATVTRVEAEPKEGETQEDEEAKKDN